MKYIALSLLLLSFVPIQKIDERMVKMKLHTDGHWYPMNENTNEKDLEWSGRLDGFKPSKEMNINDPTTWPTILNF